MTDSATGGVPAANPAAGERLLAKLNYLRWFAAEDEPSFAFPLNSDTALQWFCQTLQQQHLVDVLKARYRNLIGSDDELFVFPAEEALIEKVLIPLHQAKVAYVLGHELGCIALAGMVAEMLATLRFKVSRFGSGEEAMTESRQERLFGKSFERLQHTARVGTLELLQLIDHQTADEFMVLSRIRNKYLHRLSEPHQELARDAAQAYRIAVKLAVKVLGLGSRDGGVAISPEVLVYIKARPKLEVDSYDIDEVTE